MEKVYIVVKLGPANIAPQEDRNVAFNDSKLVIKKLIHPLSHAQSLRVRAAYRRQLELNFIFDQPKGTKTSDYVTTDQGVVEYHES
jgi:hypothetical protein